MAKKQPTNDNLQELKAAAEAKIPGFRGDKIILNATHTHTAPRFYLKRGYDKAPKDRVNIYPHEKYRAFLLEQMVKIGLVKEYRGIHFPSYEVDYTALRAFEREAMS